MRCRRSIFSVCVVILLLACCHTQKGEILQSRTNIKADTAFISDTVHNKTTERYYIREVRYKDTIVNGEVKETYIYRNMNESRACKQNMTSTTRRDTTSTTLKTKADKESKPSKLMEIFFNIVAAVVIILVVLLVVVLYLRHNRR